MLAGAVVCAAAVAALLLAEWQGRRAAAGLAKTLASAAFLFSAWQAGALATPYGRGIAAALLLCAVGDVLLIPRERAAVFLAGIGAFLLGHVAYTAAFLRLGVDPGALAAGALATTALAGLAWRWLAPHLEGGFRVAVPVYVIVIGAMVATAVGAVGAGGSGWIAAGAIGFAVSDVAVARERFVAKRFANGAWGLPLYYAAQLALARTTAV